MAKLTKHFSSEEFACKCGCGKASIDPNLVAVLEMMRESIGQPLRIASGVRCHAHNAKVGGKPDSAHLHGKAVDIICTTSRLRHDILDAAYQCGFRRVGIHSSFIHLDCAEHLPQDVCWVY
ncbi:MAG: D-Ala-D-Ala carboxypeptidase family metallohydrolase [Desulfuromonadales bacterium]|nr:D-Ala-D-Ala carboxypeptidase family metallohydrolase [Desulfuromonadales bacterium]